MSAPDLAVCGERLPDWWASGSKPRWDSNWADSIIGNRTSHQIRSQADKLLDSEITDADGNVEKRGNPVSAFNGPPPTLSTFNTPDEEIEAVALWLASIRDVGIEVYEIAVFVRSESELPWAVAAMEKAALPFNILNTEMEINLDKATLAVMHLAKGLEFKAVAVMAYDTDAITSRKRIEDMGDDADLPTSTISTPPNGNSSTSPPPAPGTDS